MMDPLPMRTGEIMEVGGGVPVGRVGGGGVPVGSDGGWWWCGRDGWWWWCTCGQ